MKHLSLIAMVALALLANGFAGPPITAATRPKPAHTSQNALDWAGVYRGVIPCADCQGIETVVVLKSDGTFTALSRYLGKGDEVFSRDGHFAWNRKGNTVKLAGDAPNFGFWAHQEGNNEACVRRLRSTTQRRFIARMNHDRFARRHTLGGRDQTFVF